MKSKTFISIATALAVLLVATMAFASSGAEGAHGEEGSPWRGFMFSAINFAIFATALIIIYKKFDLGSLLRSRTEAIEKGIAEAREAKEAAQRALDEVRARFDKKDAEIKEMLEAAERSGQRESEALVLEGERMAQKLIEQTRNNIEHELKQAREALKAEAVALALEVAEQKIKERLTPEAQQRLLEDVIAKLETRKS